MKAQDTLYQVKWALLCKNIYVCNQYRYKWPLWIQLFNTSCSTCLSSCAVGEAFRALLIWIHVWGSGRQVHYNHGSCLSEVIFQTPKLFFKMKLGLMHHHMYKHESQEPSCNNAPLPTCHKQVSLFLHGDATHTMTYYNCTSHALWHSLKQNTCFSFSRPQHACQKSLHSTWTC